MRPEEGSSEVAFLLYLAVLWMALIALLIATDDNTYDSKDECLKTWADCKLTSQTWEPVKKAD